MVFDGFYEDEYGDFSLALYMRPWGQDWSDVSGEHTMRYENMLPFYYETWYLPMIEAGKPMPDVVGGGDVLAPGQVPDDQLEGQGGEDDYPNAELAPGPVPDDQLEGQSGEYYDPNADAVDGTYLAPVYGDYGLSKANVTGIVPLDTLIKMIKWYSDSQIGYALYDTLYNTMGFVHGRPLRDDPEWLTSETHVYAWSAETGEYAIMVFKVGNYDAGIEYLQSIRTSAGLLD